jgi:hypothetical protein
LQIILELLTKFILDFEVSAMPDVSAHTHLLLLIPNAALPKLNLIKTYYEKNFIHAALPDLCNRDGDGSKQRCRKNA